MTTVLRIGEAVDRLVSVDFSARGFIPVLYDEARRLNQNRPLCLSAAEELIGRTKKGQAVVIATGLPIRGWFSGAMAENDGPIGAAALARSLYLAVGALPVLLCEESQLNVLRACVRTVGLTPTTFEQYESALASPAAQPGRALPVAVVMGFTTDSSQADAEAEHILNKSPSAMISIERQGADEAGQYHYGRGEVNPAEFMAKIDRLFEIGHERGVFTIGIGDGGNELGMGNIRDAIKAKLPFGDKIAPRVKVSLLVSAVVSNFGAYGIAACLGALREDLCILHSPEHEHELIRTCVQEGAVDGVTGFVEPFVDALPSATCESIARLLIATVKNGLTPSAIFRV